MTLFLCSMATATSTICLSSGFSSPKLEFGSGGIRTHAIEMTGALDQRLRPLGHATCTVEAFPQTVHHANYDYNSSTNCSVLGKEWASKIALAP